MDGRELVKPMHGETYYLWNTEIGIEEIYKYDAQTNNWINVAAQAQTVKHINLNPRLPNNPQISPKYRYPDGQLSTTEPKDNQIWIIWNSTTGHPKETWKYDASLGDWVDVTYQPFRMMGLSEQLDEWEKSKQISIEDKCECGTHNQKGQGHSSWCKMYEREF